jgi:hypothetical protein
MRVLTTTPPSAPLPHRYDLNQFNHVAVPTEVTSFTFEDDRIKYCKFVTAHEDKVEDAITGNLLLIKDQLIFLALADIPGGTAPPQYQVMKDVPELSREQVR